ncbi:MAG: hypothetical protein HQK96_12125, partial [Nitrospirae bacterium]|nr:hypothetical protein [Nitrospirota bacterium]
KGIAITLVTPLEFKELTRIMEFSGAPIVYEEVPTITQAMRRHQNTLVSNLTREHIAEEAVEIIQRLSEDMDCTQIACKAVSMLLGKQQVAGPNRIGLTTREVERIMHRATARQKAPRRVPSRTPARRLGRYAAFTLANPRRRY